MAINSQKMTRWAWDTKLSTLATNTTLGTATRYDTEVQTMYVPETTRTFERVLLRVTVRDAETTTVTDLDGFRLGIKINAVAFSDVDTTMTLANSADPWMHEFERDVTSYFTTNDPGTASFSIQAACAFATGAASLVNNVTFELLATYTYDDGASTHCETAVFPIQSHHTTISTSYVEVGTTGGTTNAPANQIRKLTGSGGAFDGITGWTLRKRYLIVMGSEGNTSAGTTDQTPTYRFDGGGTTYTRATIEQALSGDLRFQDIIDITALSTSSAHSFEVISDVTTRLACFGALDVVTYEFTESSTQQFVSVVIPLENTETYAQYSPRSEDSASDPSHFAARLSIQEPGTITIDQCGVSYLKSYTTTSSVNIHATGQIARPYSSINALPFQPHWLVHRCDHSSSTWTLARGVNALVVQSYTTSISQVSIGFVPAFAYINYRCERPAGGTSRKNRTVFAMQISAYTEGLQSITTPTAPAIEESEYTLQAVWATTCIGQSGKNTVGHSAKRFGDELLGGGWVHAYAITSPSSVESFTDISPVPFTRPWKTRDSEVSTRKLSLTRASRKWKTDPSSSTATAGHWAALYATYHAITFTVAGTVEVDGTPVANSKTVQVFAIDSDGVVELVGEALTTGGTGSFTLEVPDDTRTYWASYKDGTTVGRSDTATPGSGTFDIAISTGTGSGTRPVGSGRVRRYS